MIEVAAALIWENGKFMICQRPKHKARGLLWEFVGGKAEPGEDLRTALVRECREELGIEIFAGGKYISVLHEYPDISIKLTVFSSFIKHGQPQLLEHNDLRYISVSEIPLYDFCPADKLILEKLTNKTGPQSPGEILRSRLFDDADPEYRLFHSRLVPNLDPGQIIGVRTPQLRAIAKDFSNCEAANDFMNELPHEYYEENNVHGCLICGMKDYTATIAGLDAFLPYVDNWATCDMITPKAFKKHLPELYEKIEEWIDSGEEYTVRFGLEMIMCFYLDGAFKPEYLEKASSVRSDKYYVNMMTAWLFATALAKQYDAALPYIQNHRLDSWTHNKAIQKAVESRRITDEQKNYLKLLK